MKKLSRHLSLILSIPLLVSFVLPPVPAFALRGSVENKTPDLVAAGMEAGAAPGYSLDAAKEAVRTSVLSYSGGAPKLFSVAFVDPPESSFDLKYQLAVVVRPGEGSSRTGQLTIVLGQEDMPPSTRYFIRAREGDPKTGRLLFLSKETPVVWVYRPDEVIPALERALEAPAVKKWFASQTGSERAGLEDVELIPMDEQAVQKHGPRLRHIFQMIPSTAGTDPDWDAWSDARRDARFSFVAVRNGPLQEGQAVGLLIGEVKKEYSDAVYMSWLGTYRDNGEDWRRKGVGWLLMSRLFSAARDAGFSRVVWHVNQDNLDARRFYDSLPGTYVAEIVQPDPAEEKVTHHYVTLLGLTDQSPSARLAAIWRIGLSDISAAAPALFRVAIDDVESKLRQEAEDVLAGMGEKVVPFLVDVIKGKDSGEVVHLTVLSVLGRIGPPAKEAIPQLESLHKSDPSWKVRMGALDVLKKVRGKNPIEERVSPILWAGDLSPRTQVIGGQPQQPEVNVDFWAPSLPPWKVLDSFELQMVVEGPGGKEFPVAREMTRLDPDRHGLGRENYRIWVGIPQKVQELMARRGYLSYTFEYRLKGKQEWEKLPPQDSKKGELIYHPGWLSRHGMTTINVKAWHSDDHPTTGRKGVPGLEAIRRRLPELAGLGAKVILLQGIHPGHSVFEIDDYEAVDPRLGGEEGLKRLIAEGKKLDIRFMLPFVPGHASPLNPLIQQDNGDLFFKPSPEQFPESQTIKAKVNNEEVLFLRGNVFPKGTVQSAEIPEGFGPTVQFNLWNAGVRAKMADYWEKVLGKQAEWGIDGFYTDTSHSINIIAPGWLDGIYRRIRANHPGVIFGDEAFWGKDGVIIGEGSSFAQPKWLYEEHLLELLYGRKNMSELARVLDNTPADMLQREAIFWQNHDGNVDPLALHAEWSYAARPDELAGAMGILQILGMPGIPSTEIGQLSGDKEKWNVTGNPGNYDRQWNYGYHPQAPWREPFDPFADQSDRAKRFRKLYAKLYQLRAGNPAFWWARGTRYPISYPHVFASYRSAGSRRALVITNVNRTADPGSRREVQAALSELSLSELEMTRLTEALKNPSLVWPAPSAELPKARIDQGYLKIEMDPIQAVVFEYDVAAAGAEEKTIQRLRMLEEGRAGRGILVVPDYLAAKSRGLERFLAGMPDELASEVVLWGKDPLLDRLRDRNPALRRFRGDFRELGPYLERLLPADRVGVLADQEAVAMLAPRMRRLGVAVTLVRWNISEILEILGDPQEVSSQVGLDELVGELFTESGT